MLDFNDRLLIVNETKCNKTGFFYSPKVKWSLLSARPTDLNVKHQMK